MNSFEMFKSPLVVGLLVVFLPITVFLVVMPSAYTYKVTSQDEITLLDGSVVTGMIVIQKHLVNGLQNEAQVVELQTQFKKSLQYFLSSMTRLEAVSFFNTENIVYLPKNFYEKINFKHLPDGVDIFLKLYVAGEELCPLQMFYVPK